MSRAKRIIIGFLIIIALGILMSIIDILFGITYSNKVVEISYKTLTGLCLLGCGWAGLYIGNSK